MRRPFLFRIIRSRPRLAISILLGFLVGWFLPESLAPRAVTRMIIGWNAGVCFYLILAVRMMFWSTREKMQTRAKLQDEGQALILTLVILAALASLASLFVELAIVKEKHDIRGYGHLALAGLSIATSWLFTHLMFALHYAHDFYVSLAKKQNGGVLFPNEEFPDYADFLYLSFIIGTSAQTADVSFTSKQMRRTALVHCVFSFFFNTTLLALTVNLAADLL